LGIVRRVIPEYSSKYGDCVSSKRWITQFKELKLMALVYNLDLDVKKLSSLILGFLQS